MERHSQENANSDAKHAEVTQALIILYIVLFIIFPLIVMLVFCLVRKWKRQDIVKGDIAEQEKQHDEEMPERNTNVKPNQQEIRRAHAMFTHTMLEEVIMNRA